MGLMSIFEISGSGMAAQTVRLNATASNLANAQSTVDADGELYKARYPVFQTALRDASGIGGVEVTEIVESNAPNRLRYEPDHPAAREDGYVEYPNVSVVQEMTDMISASRSFQMNVELMNTARSMAERLLAIGQ